ncbi:hypothetical protein GCM10023220_64720 [Streptomyces ziwulingensis]|uniref:Uncharacterized protein n=1 Tax=Streptomyces ziwulingensis TaxID=1045501 RepID=A0ABP9D3J5_9ACTN
MRPIYVCVGCAVTYLPPEHPSSGPPVSPAHCGKPACEEAVRQAVVMSGLSEGRIGELARRAVGVEGEQRLLLLRRACGLEGASPLSRRAVRGRRAGAPPGGGRSRLR